MFLLIVNKLLCREKFINTLNIFLENLENIQLKLDKSNCYYYAN